MVVAFLSVPQVNRRESDQQERELKPEKCVVKYTGRNNLIDRVCYNKRRIVLYGKGLSTRILFRIVIELNRRGIISALLADGNGRVLRDGYLDILVMLEIEVIAGVETLALSDAVFIPLVNVGRVGAVYRKGKGELLLSVKRAAGYHLADGEYLFVVFLFCGQSLQQLQPQFP